jgi:uncharacterized protein (DUF1697 family)
MDTWIALLRGVNVGGRNRLPMKELIGRLEARGLHNVKAYIQSGNLVLSCPKARSRGLAEEIGQTIQEGFGFLPGVALLSLASLEAARAANPFPEAEKEGQFLHLFFLSESPKEVKESALERLRSPSERWQLRGSVFYLHTPEGMGQSKLGVRVEKILGVTATARNLRTVDALLELARPPAKARPG